MAEDGPPIDPSVPTPLSGEPTPPTGETIVEQEIERELQDSYLTYAMSTIMDRALPDVRDGLKPSQRRILYSMHLLNLRPNRKPLKCAKICGNTSGDFHPHGESVIYPTLVGMAQKWRMRVPLILPQGNFGSLDGDEPAAMRYTEARMSWAAVDMLADINLGTVDFQPNYDDRLQEPMVLPGKFPNLLINGTVGIAVGMATSLAPHNPTEVFDAIIRVIENPEVRLADLMEDVTDEKGNVVRRGIKGPDFPTGGVIHGRSGIVEAYATGRGKIALRGVCHVEPMKGDRQQIVIDQVPFNMQQEVLVEKIADAANEGRLKDVSDARNESGRLAQSRVVVELKKGADPRVVENQLYEFTPLQQTFSIINIALVNRRPRTLALLEMIRLYIDHRADVVRRRTTHLLHEASKKAHVFEGLIYAVGDIDEVIRIIRSSGTREEAIQRLMDKRFRLAEAAPYYAAIPERFKKTFGEGLRRSRAAGDAEPGVGLTRVQAEAIGGMRLIQLVGLEIEKIVADYNALIGEIEGHERILADPALVMAILKRDCEEMRARYDTPRVTRIEEAAGDINIEALIQREDMAVTISHEGYAKRVPLKTYRQQGRGGKGILASDSKDEDFIEHLFVASTHDDLLCFTNTGRVFKMKVYELPELSRTSKGRAIVNLLETREGETVRAFLAIGDFESGGHFLTFASRAGIVKRTALKEYRNVHKGGLIAVGLKEGDELLDVCLTTGSDDILLATASGMAIRFDERDARLMGRPAAGVKGIELAEGDEVIAAIPIPMKPDAEGDMMSADPTLSLLTITENGYGKRTAMDEYRVQPETGKPRSQSRGGKGRIDINTSERKGRAVAAMGVRPGDDVVVISRGGQLVRVPAGSIRECGRGTQGVRVVSLNEGDRVIAAATVAEREEGAATA